MKCANCENNASYEYKITKGSSLFYCGKDLPNFLDERRKAGLLTITEKFTEDLTSALNVLGTSTVDTLKPKKKTIKKSEE